MVTPSPRCTILVTHSTLVKVIWLISVLLCIYVIYDFIPATLLPHWRTSTQIPANTDTPLSQPNQTQATEKPLPVYVEAPPIFDQLFSSPDPSREDFQEWNAKTLRDLHACMALNNCGPNQMKVALLADNNIQRAVIQGFRGGEGIWGMSIYKNLRELGYTTLFSTDLEDTLFQYRMMPDLVKVIIRSETGECHLDPDCIKGPENPTGIPAWKLFDMSYWPSHREHDEDHPMKGKWVLSAVPDRGYPDFESSPIQYIGYSIEATCTKTPVIPLEKRKNQVWMLMKQLLYVYHPKFAWNSTYFPLVHEKLGVNFVGGWKIDKNYLNWGKDIHEEIVDIEDHENGIYNLGILSPEDFYDQVRNSKMMIGMRNPLASPSPIDALCLGVPSLNPIERWNHEDPWNKSHWETQHHSLVEYDPPYVYHVHAKNFTGFLEAIENAIKTPIDRLIPEHMTEKAVKERLTKLMETDWRAKAEEVLEENMKKVKQGEEAYIFEL